MGQGGARRAHEGGVTSRPSARAARDADAVAVFDRYTIRLGQAAHPLDNALSHRGVGQLLETITDVRSFTNAHLEVLGVVATMYDPRTRLAQSTLADVQAA